MTDANAPSASARLYSQTDHDERGNFHYEGDLYRADEALPSLASRIDRHLAQHFTGTSFAIRTETLAGGRKDFWSCSFYSEARIGQAYWTALAKRQGIRNPVDTVLSLAAFKKRVKAGDRLRLLDAPSGHRLLGTTRDITKVRSGDLILEGRSYLSFPRASAFACDGRLIRIAIGSQYGPDDHLLYEWLRAS